MKLAMFTAALAILSIVTVRVYTIVQRDDGLGCSEYWTFVGEEDLQKLQKRNLTGSPLTFRISENVSGTLTNLDIRHTTGLESLSSIAFISNNSNEPISTDMYVKLVHKDREYQMEKVMLHSDFSIDSSPNIPLKLNLEANSELYANVFFNYEIFDPTLKKQSLHQIVFIKTEDKKPKILAQQQLTRVKRTFNCFFGTGHSFRPG